MAASLEQLDANTAYVDESMSLRGTAASFEEAHSEVATR
jgi:hypothetical protein